MAFFTIEEVIIFLDEPNLSVNQEATLSMIVDASEKRMENFCNRIFEETEHTEIHNGNGKYYLNVNYYPVTSANADIVIQIDDDDAIDTTDDDIFKIDKVIGKLYNANGFTSGFQNVNITYTAGYAVLPDDLKYALLMLIQSNWNKFREKSTDVTEYTVNDITKKYQFADIPTNARKIFNSYRTVNV